MNRSQLIELLKSMDLANGEWCVFGGACLAAHELRNTNDIDIFVSSKLYEELRDSGWEEKITNSTNSPYLRKILQGVEIQVFITCGTKLWRPKAEQYINNPEVIDGIPFMPLSEMYAWKAATRRPKDIDDLKIMEPYLKRTAKVSN